MRRIEPGSRVVIVNGGRVTGKIGMVMKGGGRKIEVKIDKLDKPLHFFPNQLRILNA